MKSFSNLHWLSRGSSCSSTGFTLLETIAVLAIVGLLSAVAVSSGYNFWVRLQVDEAQNNIYSAIRTARANARSSAGSGRAWVARIDNTGEIPVIFIEDIDGSCRDIIPCEVIPLSNLVDVNIVGLANDRVGYNSRGLRFVEGSPAGSFRVTSPFLNGIERCVTVSDAVIGTIRKGC